MERALALRLGCWCRGLLRLLVRVAKVASRLALGRAPVTHQAVVKDFAPCRASLRFRWLLVFFAEIAILLALRCAPAPPQRVVEDSAMESAPLIRAGLGCGVGAEVAAFPARRRAPAPEQAIVVNLTHAWTALHLLDDRRIWPVIDSVMIGMVRRVALRVEHPPIGATAVDRCAPRVILATAHCIFNGLAHGATTRTLVIAAIIAPRSIFARRASLRLPAHFL